MKEFNDTTSEEKESADIIRSIVRLNSTDGATDDASCLKEISGSITPEEERQLKMGKHIKIVFEITDGASSFPGLTKDAVQELFIERCCPLRFSNRKEQYSKRKNI